jgi:hypothetical protein
MKRFALFLLSCLAVSSTARSATVYALQFEGPLTRVSDDPCREFLGQSQLVFHNSLAATAIIHLLDTSNGGPQAGAQDVAISAGRTISVLVGEHGWFPPAPFSVYAVTLDVPEGVVMVDRAEPSGLDTGRPCSPFPGNPILVRGALLLPTTSTLTAPSEQRTFLAADLGDLTNNVYASVFNAATNPATAVITAYRDCDDAVIGTVTVTLAAQTVRQVAIPGDYSFCIGSESYGRYLTVVVDQPSFTVISTADDDPFKKMSMGISAGQ